MVKKIEKKDTTVVPRYLTPRQLGERWHFHPESIRRKIRNGEIGSIVIARRRLIQFEEILRIEAEGAIPVDPRYRRSHSKDW
jgi:hypothetical protein